MITYSAQLDAIVAAVRAIPEENFTAYRGGYPQEISTALIDAVFSIRARYDSKFPGSGVRNRVQAFREEHGDAVNDLSALVALGANPIAQVMGSSMTGGRLKAEAVVEAAEGYSDAGVNTADELRAIDSEQAKRIYTTVPGLGHVTFEYFSMLLGIPGVKTDVMIRRFVSNALKVANLGDVDAATARKLIIDAHRQTGLGESLTHFDHAVWLSESQLSEA